MNILTGLGSSPVIICKHARIKAHIPKLRRKKTRLILESAHRQSPPPGKVLCDIKTSGQQDLGNLAETNFYQLGHQCTRLFPCPNLYLIANLSWEIGAWLCAKERGAPVISHQAAPSLRFDSTTDGSAPIVCSNPCESRVMCLNGITGVWTRIFTEVLFTLFKIWKQGYPLTDIFLNKL